MPYLSASAVVFHYEEALYQVYGPLPFTFTLPLSHGVAHWAMLVTLPLSYRGCALGHAGYTPSVTWGCALGHAGEIDD